MTKLGMPKLRAIFLYNYWRQHQEFVLPGLCEYMKIIYCAMRVAPAIKIPTIIWNTELGTGSLLHWLIGIRVDDKKCKFAKPHYTK